MQVQESCTILLSTNYIQSLPANPLPPQWPHGTSLKPLTLETLLQNEHWLAPLSSPNPKIKENIRRQLDLHKIEKILCYLLSKGNNRKIVLYLFCLIKEKKGIIKVTPHNLISLLYYTCGSVILCGPAHFWTITNACLDENHFLLHLCSLQWKNSLVLVSHGCPLLELFSAFWLHKKQHKHIPISTKPNLINKI